MGRMSADMNFSSEFSSISQDSDRLSISSQSMVSFESLCCLCIKFSLDEMKLCLDELLYDGVQEDVEAEMRRLKLELKQTMEMYSTACKEALTAKQKVSEVD